MPFAIQTDSGIPMLIAYEEVSSYCRDPQPTLSAQLIAGWICPECNEVLRAVAGPWSDQRARWWEYDHIETNHSVHVYEKPRFRPDAAQHMPHYRGSFWANGGYLYRFDHNALVNEQEYYRSRISCSLGVSLRVGIEAGLSRMRHNTPALAQAVAADIEAYGPSDLVVLIPDIVGQREVIVATKHEAISKWNEMKSGKYRDEDIQEAWRKFAQTLTGRYV